MNFNIAQGFCQKVGLLDPGKAILKIDGPIFNSFSKTMVHQFGALRLLQHQRVLAHLDAALAAFSCS